MYWYYGNNMDSLNYDYDILDYVSEPSLWLHRVFVWKYEMS